MIDLTKKYKTRDGHSVFSLRTHDEDDNYPITGEVHFLESHSSDTLTWTDDGRFDYGAREHKWDLVEDIKEKPVEPTPEPKKDWPQFDPTKQYVTRSGKPFRYYASDGGGSHPIHGAVQEGNGVWLAATWTAQGLINSLGPTTDHDLVEVKPRIKREIWLNINPEVDDVFGYITKERADDDRDKGCIACVKVIIDCEHGEGL